MTEQPKTELNEDCGPHCGVKDGKKGHCVDCHARKTHGNSEWSGFGWKVQ